MTDYSGYEVHRTRPDWNSELIAVLKNGNKGPIVAMTTGVTMPTGDNLPATFKVLLSENGMCDVNEREIDHYLTPPKPKEMPDHPGLWKDCDGALWVYDGRDMRLVKDEERWMANGPTVNSGFAKLYTPFIKWEVKEKDQQAATRTRAVDPDGF